MSKENYEETITTAVNGGLIGLMTWTIGPTSGRLFIAVAFSGRTITALNSDQLFPIVTPANLTLTFLLTYTCT